MVWVPGPPEDATMALGRLERQNPDLNTTGWQVFAENVGATSDGRNLVLGISESGALKLKTLDYKPYLGMDQVTFKVSGMSQGEREGGRKGLTRRSSLKMGPTGVAFTQINLHPRRKGASAVLAKRLAGVHTAISLIQEPWLAQDGCQRFGRVWEAV